MIELRGRARVVFGAVAFLAPLWLSSALGRGAEQPTPATAPAPINDTWAVGRSAAVVTAEPHASKVGLEVLEAGGNAVDAAVAVALALAVTHPQAGNLGGGGFMLVRMADGRTAAWDFREKAPARAHRDMYLREDGSVHPEMSLWGATAAGVPGSPAGLLAALEEFGSKPLADLAAPAIRLAREGIPVSHFLAASLRGKARVLGRFETTRKVLFDGDRPLRLGDRLVQEDLAQTLERFAKDGFDGFYKGKTAELIVAEMKRGGGFIALEDLADYEPARREPLVGNYRGHEVLSMPPPSSGGIALLQMLGILEGFDLRASGFGAAQTIHLVAESMRRAYADRARWLGDADFYPVPVAGLLAADYLDGLRASIDPAKTTEVAPGRPAGGKEGNDTTHFSIVDAAGNAVSCTTTINSTFGSGLVVGGAGFLLNNEMDDFSAKPGVPNQFGLVGGEANAIQPGKRMLSSMTPTIVLKDGKLRYVLGAPGGGRIINGVMQVLLNAIEFEMSIEDAVAAPRFHHQWKPEHISWERLAISPDTRRILEGMGHAFSQRPISGVARVQAIEVRSDGTRVAAADPRSGGTALAR